MKKDELRQLGLQIENLSTVVSGLADLIVEDRYDRLLAPYGLSYRKFNDHYEKLTPEKRNLMSAILGDETALAKCPPDMQEALRGLKSHG